MALEIPEVSIRRPKVSFGWPSWILHVGVPVSEEAKMVASIFGMKSLTLCQFMHSKQGLPSLDFEIGMLWYQLRHTVSGEDCMAFLYSISEEI